MYAPSWQHLLYKRYTRVFSRRVSQDTTGITRCKPTLYKRFSFLRLMLYYLIIKQAREGTNWHRNANEHRICLGSKTGGGETTDTPGRSGQGLYQRTT